MLQETTQKGQFKFGGQGLVGKPQEFCEIVRTWPICTKTGILSDGHRYLLVNTDSDAFQWNPDELCLDFGLVDSPSKRVKLAQQNQKDSEFVVRCDVGVCNYILQYIKPNTVMIGDTMSVEQLLQFLVTRPIDLWPIAVQNFVFLEQSHLGDFGFCDKVPATRKLWNRVLKRLDACFKKYKHIRQDFDAKSKMMRTMSHTRWDSDDSSTNDIVMASPPRTAKKSKKKSKKKRGKSKKKVKRKKKNGPKRSAYEEIVKSSNNPFVFGEASIEKMFNALKNDEYEETSAEVKKMMRDKMRYLMRNLNYALTETSGCTASSYLDYSQRIRSCEKKTSYKPPKNGQKVATKKWPDWVPFTTLKTLVFDAFDELSKKPNLWDRVQAKAAEIDSHNGWPPNTPEQEKFALLSTTTKKKKKKKKHAKRKKGQNDSS